MVTSGNAEHGMMNMSVGGFADRRTIYIYIDSVRKAERCDANLYDTLQNIAGERFASRTSSFTCPTRAGPSVDALELSSSSRLERVAIGGATNE